MVDEKKQLTPIVCIAVIGLSLIYILNNWNPIVLIISLFFCAFLCISCGKVHFIKNGGNWNLFSVYLISFGIAIFFALCVFLNLSLLKKNFISLANPEQVATIQCTLLEDPSPYGKENYSARVKLINLVTFSESIFSAQGTINLILPKKMIEQAYPGAIGIKGVPLSSYNKGQSFIFSGQMKHDNHTGTHRFFVYSQNTTHSVLKPIKTPYWFAMRSTLRLRLMRLLYEWNDAGGFLLALTSGEKSFLSDDIAQNFKRTGLSHILALSGMHLSLVGLVAGKFGRKVGGVRGARFFICIIALAFVWFAGVSPSLNRALIMVLISALLASFGIKIQVLSLLALSVCIQVFINPLDCLSLAFMLSYGALAGIVLCSKALLYITEQKISSQCSTDIIASIGAQLLTTPIIVLYIGVLAPIGIIASVIISPLANMFMIIGSLCAFFSALFPSFAFFIQIIPIMLYKCISFLVFLFAQCPPLPTKSTTSKIIAGIVSLTGIVIIQIVYVYIKKRRTSNEFFARL